MPTEGVGLELLLDHDEGKGAWREGDAGGHCGLTIQASSSPCHAWPVPTFHQNPPKERVWRPPPPVTSSPNMDL